MRTYQLTSHSSPSHRPVFDRFWLCVKGQEYTDFYAFCQRLRPRQCIERKVIYLEADYNLTNHTFCEVSGLHDQRVRWQLVSIPAQTMCLYSQYTHAVPQPPPLGISILCAQLLNQPRALVWLLQGLLLLLCCRSSGSVVRASEQYSLHFELDWTVDSVLAQLCKAGYECSLCLVSYCFKYGTNFQH